MVVSATTVGHFINMRETAVSTASVLCAVVVALPSNEPFPKSKESHAPAADSLLRCVCSARGLRCPLNPHFGAAGTELWRRQGN